MRRPLFSLLSIAALSSQALAGPIPGYPNATTPLTGSEVVVGNQSGITKQFTTNSISLAAPSRNCNPGTVGTLPQQGFACTATTSTYSLPTTINFESFQGIYAPYFAVSGGYNTNIAKSNYWPLYMPSTNYTQGQHIIEALSQDNYGVGDNLGIALLQQSEGGSNATTDEGQEPVEFARIEGNIPLTATLLSGSTGSQSVTLNTPSVGAGTQGAGRFLHDVTDADGCASGNTVTTINTAINTLTTMTLSANCPASTAQTTASGNINVVNNVGGQSVNIAVADSTNFTTGVITIADALAFETARVTAVPDGTHITALVHKPHQTGAFIAQGGEAGNVLVLTPDIYTATGTYAYWVVPAAVPQALPISYSDATHLYVWIDVAGSWSQYIGQATKSAGSNAFNIYPAAEVLDVSNGTGAPSLTFTLAPNTVPWSPSDSVMLPPYPYTKQSFGVWYGAKMFHSPIIALDGFIIQYAGMFSDSDTALKLVNSGQATQYVGVGGGKSSKPFGIQLQGPYSAALTNQNYPDTAVIDQRYDATIGLPTDYRILETHNSDGSVDTVVHNASTKQWVFSAGGNTIFYTFSPTTLTAANVNVTTAITAASYKSGGAVGVTCSGAPTGSFHTTNGIVDHC